MKKSKKLKIQNRFLVIKQNKINKISNPSGYLYFPARYEELKYIYIYTHSQHTHTHTHTRARAHTHTHTHPRKQKSSESNNTHKYRHTTSFWTFFFWNFVYRYKASSMRKQLEKIDMRIKLCHKTVFLCSKVFSCIVGILIKKTLLSEVCLKIYFFIFFGTTFWQKILRIALKSRIKRGNKIWVMSNTESSALLNLLTTHRALYLFQWLKWTLKTITQTKQL